MTNWAALCRLSKNQNKRKPNQWHHPLITQLSSGTIQDSLKKNLPSFLISSRQLCSIYKSNGSPSAKSWTPGFHIDRTRWPWTHGVWWPGDPGGPDWQGVSCVSAHFKSCDTKNFFCSFGSLQMGVQNKFKVEFDVRFNLSSIQNRPFDFNFL